MKRLFTLTILALALIAPSSASAHYPLTDSRSCSGAVILKPGTDFAAFDFRVRNMGCRAAKRVGAQWATRDRSPFSFRCVSRPRRVGDGRNAQAHSDVRCRSGNRAVVFVVT